MSRPRVVCFIDSSNLFSFLRDAHGSGKYRQDALCEALAGPDRDLLEWRFYAASLPEGESDRQVARHGAQQRFFDVIRSRPRPYPHDEEPVGGLVWEDIAGDGRMLMMRIPDPNGAWKISPEEPRLLVRRHPAEGGGQYYRLLREGRIDLGAMHEKYV